MFKLVRNCTVKRYLSSFRASFNLNCQNLTPNLNRKSQFSTKYENKFFMDHENSFMHKILIDRLKRHEVFDIRSPENSIRSLDEFNRTLDRNWRDSNIFEIVNCFKNVKQFCLDNDIALQDERFDKLVDGLMDHCDTINDQQLYELIKTLTEYPFCDSYTSHNFHDVWSCLDDICIYKMQFWSMKTVFEFCDLWYKWHLVKFSDFIYETIDRNINRAHLLTKDELVQMYFVINVCRRKPVAFEYENAVLHYIKEFSIEELAIVALGHFKSKMKIKTSEIVEEMILKVIENYDNVHEMVLTPILKVLRMSQPKRVHLKVLEMFRCLESEIDRFSIVCCMHIALAATGIQTYNEKILMMISNKILKDISDIGKVRLKDIERMLNVLTMYDLDPKSKPDFFQAALEQLENKEREKELQLYPRCLPCSLNYLSSKEIFSYELLNKVLDFNFIKEIYGGKPGNLPRELLLLDNCIDIYCQDYKGNRIPSILKHKAAKYLSDYAPSEDQYKKLTPADKLFIDTVKAVKASVDPDFVQIHHVLPHFWKADIVLCKDKKRKEFVKPEGLDKYLLGDVMFPPKNEKLEWFAIFIIGWNLTIRDTSIPFGAAIIKKRQLEKIGYKPIMVIWNEFMNLSETDKVLYIKNKLS